MHFGIYGKYEINDINLHGNKTILVRIFDPQDKNLDNLDLKNRDLYNGILTLYIEDTSISLENEEYLKRLKDSFDKLNDFILNSEFDEVIAHCSYGISRSPAIMICIAKILENKEMEEYIKSNFERYNKSIVKNFNNYNIKKKESFIDQLYLNNYLDEPICIYNVKNLHKTK